MKNDQYFKHDATASFNRKLMMLIRHEGMRGYGLYWFLLETLRCQPQMCAPLNLLPEIARRACTRTEFVLKIVQNYDLFVVADGVFRSKGLDRRMRHFVQAQAAHTPATSALDPRQLEGQINPNSLTDNAHEGDNARVAEKSREENSNNSNSPAAAATPLPPPIRPWQSLVDEMVTDTFWMELVGMRSGLGELYVEHRNKIVDLFRRHICLYDKGGGLLRLQDAKQYFANYLAAGSRTCGAVREELLAMLRRQQTEAGVSIYETLVDGHRTYLGRPIPDDAPPRPDEYAVWDEEAQRWTR